MTALTRGTVATPWGDITLEIGAHGVRRVCFAHADDALTLEPWTGALAGYLAGQPLPLELPVDLSGVPAFSRRVLDACRAIPFGATRTYAQLAAELGSPRAARAVGQALARNPVPVIIPCHRVIGSSGALTGFLGGLAWKQALLAHERIVSSSGG